MTGSRGIGSGFPMTTITWLWPSLRSIPMGGSNGVSSSGGSCPRRLWKAFGLSTSTRSPTGASHKQMQQDRAQACCACEWVGDCSKRKGGGTNFCMGQLHTIYCRLRAVELALNAACLGGRYWWHAHCAQLAWATMLCGYLRGNTPSSNPAQTRINLAILAVQSNSRAPN